MRISFTIFFFLVKIALHAQTQQGRFSHELNLTLDNDAFYLVKEDDRYYTSGIFASYKARLDHEGGVYNFFDGKGKMAAITAGIHFTHLMYTPEDIKYTAARLLDRPYAGAIALGGSFNLYTKKNWAWINQLDLGVMGPSTKTKELQTWWHQVLDMKTPRGWEFQIEDTPYINWKTEVLKSQKILDWLDITYESRYEFGTIFNNIRQGGIVRVGAPKALSESGYKNSMNMKVSEGSKGRLVEWYFFWGVNYEFVFHNSTIDGNIIGAESPYVEQSMKGVTRRKFGLTLHWPTFDLGWHFYFNTPETTKSLGHKYVRIRLTKRF